MDVTKILAELRQERIQIEEAIVSLERLARGRDESGKAATDLDSREKMVMRDA